MSGKTALIIFYTGASLLCAGMLAFASLLLNLSGYEFRSLGRVYIPTMTKIVIGTTLTFAGIVITRLSAESAGKLDKPSTFIGRFKKNLGMKQPLK